MKNIKLVNVFLVFTLIVIFYNQKAESQQQDLKVQKISENVYVVFGGGGNVAFLTTEDGVVVIDSKTSPKLGEEIISKIREITNKEIKYLIFTHYHPDHIQGAQSFPKNISIISHINTRMNIEKISIPRLENQKKNILPKQLEESEKKFKKAKAENDPKSNDYEKELEAVKKRISETEKLTLIKPQICIENGSLLFIGDQEIRFFYYGNAHTNGDLIVYFVKDKILHTGDLFFNKIIPVIDFDAGSKTANWINILNKMENFDIIKVIPGHGEISDKNTLKNEAEYLTDLRNEVKKYIDQNITLEETTKKLVLEKYKSFDGYNQRFINNITAVYQEIIRDKK